MVNTIDWLNDEPRLTREHNGAKYIPIIVVKEDLNTLCSTDGDWSTSDLKAREYQENGFSFTSGSLVLYVNYNGKRRFFVGSATIHLMGNNNPHYEATLQSECIKNAAKNLGRRFGMYLNEEGKEDIFNDYEGAKTQVISKLIAGDLEKKQLAKALKENNYPLISKLNATYEFDRDTN